MGGATGEGPSVEGEWGRWGGGPARVSPGGRAGMRSRAGPGQSAVGARSAFFHHQREWSQQRAPRVQGSIYKLVLVSTAETGPLGKRASLSRRGTVSADGATSSCGRCGTLRRTAEPYPYRPPGGTTTVARGLPPILSGVESPFHRTPNSRRRSRAYGVWLPGVSYPARRRSLQGAHALGARTRVRLESSSRSARGLPDRTRNGFDG